MQTTVREAARCLVAAFLLLPAGVALAQPSPNSPTLRPGPAQPSATSPETPQQTTATYGDWVVQCVAHSGGPPDEVCDMAQITQVQGKTLPFSRVAIARPEKAQPVKLIVQVPVNASFRTQVHIQTGDADPGVIAPFSTCTPNGCFAEFDLKEDILKKWRAATDVGKLSFADAGGHDVTVPISFKGFSQAFDALVKK